jgi:hypothetical protein
VSEAALPEVLQANRGLVGKAFGAAKDKVFPMMGQLASGIDSDTIRFAGQNLDKIDDLEKGGFTSFVNDFHDDAHAAVQGQRLSIGRQMGELIDDAGETVSLKDARQPFDKLITDLEQSYADTNRPVTKDQLDEAKAVRDWLFGENPGDISARRAFEARADLQDLRGWSKENPYSLKPFGKKDQIDRKVLNAAGESYGLISKALDRATDAASQASDGATLPELRSQYKAISDLAETLNRNMSSADKTSMSLRNMDKQTKRGFVEAIKKLDDQAGTDLAERGKLVRAHAIFGNPMTDAVGGNGVTATIRGAPMGAMGGAAGYAAADYLDLPSPLKAILGGAGYLMGAKAASPAMIKNIMKANRGVTNMTNGLLDLGTSASAGGVRQGVPNSIWNMLHTNQEEKK